MWMKINHAIGIDREKNVNEAELKPSLPATIELNKKQT